MRIIIICGDPACGEEYPAETGDRLWERPASQGVSPCMTISALTGSGSAPTAVASARTSTTPSSTPSS